MLLPKCKVFVVSFALNGTFFFQNFPVFSPTSKKKRIKNSNENSLHFSVIIPPTTQASIYVPKLKTDSKTLVIYEGDLIIWKNGQFQKNDPAIHSGVDLGPAIQFETGSGHFEFHFGPIQFNLICAESKSSNQSLTLACQSTTDIISDIHFASFGLAYGSCGFYSYHQCHSLFSAKYLQQTCVGKNACQISATQQVIDALDCSKELVDRNELRWVVQATCSTKS